MSFVSLLRRDDEHRARSMRQEILQQMHELEQLMKPYTPREIQEEWQRYKREKEAAGERPTPQGFDQHLDGKSLLASCQTPSIELSSCLFCMEGKGWRITFAGKSRILPDRVGLRRIHMLLERQGEEVGVEELTGRKGLFRGEAGSDRRALEESSKRAAELSEVVESDGDPRETAEAREELERIQRHTRSFRGIRGGPRKIGDEGKRAASAVGKSVNEALSMIEQAGLGELAAHLREALVGPMSMSPAYRPKQRVNWVLLLRK